ncbi:hypothetical protein ACOI1C_22275 [Bacillus sp. DJP31]|uniref:hypothetical protein n=1 Tax=Bacillus sp. DJP31 TaxID=3409789 RepID=UPI003BB57349
MKKYLLYALSCLFLLGSALSLTYIVNSKTNDGVSTEAHADWPDKNIEELVLESDLIAVVKVKKIEKKIAEGVAEEEVSNRQLSTLSIEKVIKGEKTKEIILNQALDYIDGNENRKYFMFLTEGTDGYYYELTNLAIVPEKEGVYKSKIKGLTDEFTEDIFISNIEAKIKNENKY